MKHFYTILLTILTCLISTYAVGQELSEAPIVKGSTTILKDGSTTLIWHGDLVMADHWSIYYNECDGVPVGTTTSNSLDVFANKNANTFYVRAESALGQATSNCGSFTYNLENDSPVSFGYSHSVIKNSDEGKNVLVSDGKEGLFFSLQEGLSINSSNGHIDPTQSEDGTYQIYFFPNDNSGYALTTLGVDNTAVLSIAGTTQAAEDTTDGLFTITSDATLARDTNVSFTISGTATEGVDYSNVGTSILMPAGSSSATISINVIADSALEGLENVQITLTGTDDTDVSVGTANTASIDLTDNDNAFIILSDASGNEDGGPITVSATLSSPVQGGFTVDVNTANGSATIANGDYVAINNQTLTFSGSNNEVQTFNVIPTADTILEGDETVIVSLSNLQATALPVNISDTAIVTILNDEVDCNGFSAPDVNIQTYDSSCANGNSGAASAMLYYEGFENAQTSPAQYFDSVNPIPGLPDWRYEGAPSVGARLNIFSSGNVNRANNGSVALGLDEGNFVPQSIIWTVDLSAQAGQDDIQFAYSFFNSRDENTAEDLVSVRGDASQPWVFLSDWNDGITNRWEEREVDLDAALTAAGQTMTATTEIKFTQSDNFAFSTDGVIFDDIKIFKQGYTYSWSNNETTGVVQNLQPGNYTVVVTTPDGCQTTRNITINGTPLDDAGFSYSSTDFCATDAPATPTITGLSGGFFFTNTFGLDLNNVTGEINFVNSQPGRTYDINYQTNGPCPNISTVSVTINFSEDANFGYNANSFSTSDPIQFPFFINTTGGTFSSSPSGLSIDPVSGGIDPTTSVIGSYTVTYTTAGACPGTSSQTFTINNTDNIAPVARCQDFSGNLDANGLLTIQAFNIDAGSSDDVGVASLTASQTVFSCSDLGDNTVTLTVTDNSGNQDTCTATVTVNDVDAPVINCADVTLELDANGQASLDSLYNTGDTYDVTATGFNEETLPSPTNLSLGDDNVAGSQPLGFDFVFFGNSYNTFNISSNGFITFGNNFNSGCCQGLPLTNGFLNQGNIIALAWTDLNPRGAIISFETLGVAPNRRLIVDYDNIPFFSGGIPVSGQIKLFEGSNRIEIHSTDIQTQGRTTTQGIANQGGSSGFPVPGRDATSWSATNDAWSFTPASVYATDNCAAPTVTVSQTDFTCADLGPNIINISAVDASGNSANCTFFVTVVDNQNPEPIDAVLPDIIANCSVTSLIPPLVSDNCADPVQITNNASLPITTQGTTIVTWIYNDGNGNFNFQNQNVIIADTTPPVPDSATLPDVVAECSVSSLTAPTATEASCANGDVTINGTTTQTLPITTSGTTVITWTYEDANGNISTQDQNIVINDTVAPTPDIVNLPDLVSQCEITSITRPTATDNCAGNVLVTGNASLPLTTSGQITWTYDDGNGNTSSQTQNVIISDTTPPVPDSASLTDVTSNCEVTNLTAPTATDNCASAVQVSSDAVLPITAQGTTVVTWTYTDANNNSVTQLQNVIVDDNIAPVPDVNSLSDENSDCSVANITPPTATDNCNGSITGVSDVSFPLSTQGTTVVTWTYDDGNGNIFTQTQNVIISDTVAPVPDVGSLTDITEQCAVSTLTAPTALDNCAGAITATTDVVLPITGGTTQVVWTFDDGNGNVVTQTQNVTVSDNTAPVLDNPSLTDIDSQCAVTSLTAPTATDNCSGIITGVSNVTLPIVSNTVVTWTFDDGNGNAISQTQNIDVLDNTAPVPDVASLSDVNSQCEVAALNVPTATDNCLGAITATSDASFPITSGTTLVTWTYNDGNGNVVTQTQNVTVSDTTAPVPDVATLTDFNDFCETTSLPAPTATDNCSGSVTATSDATFPIGLGTTVVTWTYDDGNGNTVTQTQNVVVTDTDAPVADCPTDVQIAVASGTATYDLLDYTTALNATDGCTSSNNSLTIVQTPAVGSTVSVPSTTPVTITITDDSGNDTVCTFDVQVDVTASIGGPEKVDIKIDLYPNPTSDVLNISAPSEVIKSISLVDLRGRLVNKWSNTNSDTARINLASYESAVYFVRIETERGTVNKRVVKR